MINRIRKKIILNRGNYHIDNNDRNWISMKNKYGKTNKGSKNYLNKYENDIYSQNGEDGILLEIIRRAKINSKYFVEFGAWDGEKFSNTCNLRKNYNWLGSLFENRKDRVESAINSGVDCIYEEEITPHSIDNIFNNYDVPREFGLLSIDIDGDDYWVWKGMRNFMPSIVIIETHPGITNDFPLTVIPGKRDVNNGYYGANLHAMCILAEKKGYDLVTTTSINAIFIIKEKLHLLDLPKLSITDIIDKYFELSEYWYKQSYNHNIKWIRLDSI